MHRGVSQEILKQSTCETLIEGIYADAEGGFAPVIDLSSFTFFKLGALGDLLACCAAARTGRLPDVPDGLVKVVLPTDQTAADFLFNVQLFSFALSVGGIFKIPNGEFFQSDSELAVTEQRFSTSRKSTTAYPSLSFRLVLPADLNSTFEGYCYNLINDVVITFREALINRMGFTEKACKDFWIPHKEILENIYRHSKSWGFSAIQTCKEGMTIFYGDLGIGMQASLAKKKEEICARLERPWGTATAILGAFTRGVTSTPEQSRGDGLDLAKAYVLRQKGAVSCRSGDCRVTFLAQQDPIIKPVKYVPGVQLSVFLPASASMTYVD